MLSLLRFLKHTLIKADMKFPFKVVIIVLERWKNVIKAASFNDLK